MKNYTKKPFNLEYMKANPETKLVTRDGQYVTKWHFFDCKPTMPTDDYPLIAVICGRGILYTKEGFYHPSMKGHLYDLFMLVPVEEKVFYANVYEYTFGVTFESLNEAKRVGGMNHAIYIVKVTTYEGTPPTFEIVHRY